MADLFTKPRGTQRFEAMRAPLGIEGSCSSSYINAAGAYS
ncbi:hypothetical protein L917_03583 [Phytophthora nicotianae]|uniref:Uncharacterized protein n=1 Tax=Phytophthora nicotianae TaxID=4792 RepID=W2MJG3_PHYNI|nr:hypothetical protein L917_03583 [Phytophthora nicotianae]ETM35624.1 hypothetical protein L914_17499 [Phytophthora nicotianae]